MSGTKSKCIMVTMKMRIKALEWLDKGEPIIRICDKYNVVKITVNGCW